MVFNEATPIEYLNLKNRQYNILKKHDIHVVEDILDLSDRTIMVISGTNHKQMFDLRLRLKKAIADPSIIDVIDVVLYDDVPKDHTVLYYINDETPYHDCILRFINKKGAMCTDLNIDDTDLSFRIRNSMHRAGLHTVLDIVNAPYNFIKSCRNMGDQSCTQLLNCIRNITVLKKDDNLCLSIKNKKGILITYSINDITDAIYGDILCIESDEISYDKVRSCVLKLFDLLNQRSDSYSCLHDIVNDNVFMLAFYNTSLLTDIMHDNILSRIKANHGELGIDDIKIGLPSSFLAAYNIEDIMQGMIDDEVVELIDGHYYFVYGSIFEYINSYPNERWRAIVADRMSGMTLAEVADIHGMTRERIRQIVSKVLYQRPPIREDKYGYWFRKYALSKDDFSYIFETQGSVYSYLSFVCDKGKQPVDDMLIDPRMNDTLRERVRDVMNKNKIDVFGILTDANPHDILDSIMKSRYSDKAGSVDEIKADYDMICRKYNLSGRHFIVDDMHTFDARLTRDDLKMILVSRGRKARYYDIESKDIDKFVSRIDFSKYDGVCISTDKLFTSYGDMMSEYDIHNEYELHNFLRKISDRLPENIRFSRMPLLEIGDVDRCAQIEAVIEKYAPSSQSELARIFSREYGVDTVSFLMNWMKDFWKQHDYELINTNAGVFTVDEVMSLKELFSEDFYFIEDMISMCNNIYPDIDTSKLNILGLKQLGFQVYVNYAISYTYPTAKAYFTHLFETDSIVNLSKMDPRFAKLISLRHQIDRLCSQGDIVEAEPQIYMKPSQFGISKSDIELFCKQITDLDLKEPYFNAYYLRNKGILPDINDIFFSDWFCDALVRDHCSFSSYAYSSRPTMIFCRTKKYDPSEFIRYIVESVGPICMKALVAYIDDIYNLKFTPAYIQRWIFDTDVKYDSNTKILSL